MKWKNIFSTPSRINIYFTQPDIIYPRWKLYLNPYIFNHRSTRKIQKRFSWKLFIWKWFCSIMKLYAIEHKDEKIREKIFIVWKWKSVSLAQDFLKYTQSSSRKKVKYRGISDYNTNFSFEISSNFQEFFYACMKNVKMLRVNL